MFIYVKQINKMNHFLKCPQNFSSVCFFFYHVSLSIVCFVKDLLFEYFCFEISGAFPTLLIPVSNQSKLVQVLAKVQQQKNACRFGGAEANRTGSHYW